MTKIIINAEKVEALPALYQPAPMGYSPWLQLMQCLGFTATNPPLADFLRQAYGLPGRWIICEPVYWEAGHNDAILLADARMLALSDETALPLFTAVAEFLAEDGLSLHYHSAHTWLIRVDDKPRLNSLPTQLMLNRPLLALIKELDPSLYWQRLMTELQMFLQAYGKGALAVNGFWFYGYDDFYFPPKQAIFSNDALLLKAFPQQIKALDVERGFAKNDIVFINPYESHLEGLIQTKTRKNKSYWYWNNVQYSVMGRRWWHW
jgi:hypothetical protein